MAAWTEYGLIALGGALGAMARNSVGVWVQARVSTPLFPWGTLIINVTGSLLLGFVAAFLTQRGLLHSNWRPLIPIGFIGAYTTFSTFEYEAVRLGFSWQALGYVTGSVVLGYLAVMAGMRLAALLG